MRVVMQPLGDHRIGHSALEILIHGQIQIGEQLDLADQDQVVVLGKVLQQQAEFAQVVHVHQVGVVDDRHQHFAGVIEMEGLLDQSAFALEGGTFELDAKRFAEDLDRVGVGVQGSRDRGHEMLFFGEPFERFLDHRLAGAGPADDETESALLAMDSECVVDFLLVTKQFDVAQREGIVGQTEIGTDHGVGTSQRKSFDKDSGVRYFAGRYDCSFLRARPLATASNSLACPMRRPLS